MVNRYNATKYNLVSFVHNTLEFNLNHFTKKQVEKQLIDEFESFYKE